MESKKKQGGGGRRQKKECYYDVIGVDPKATQSEIKKSFYNLARKWHPDKNQNDPNATSVFQKIQEAYEVLSDPNDRAWYDLHRYQNQKYNNELKQRSK